MCPGIYSEVPKYEGDGETAMNKTAVKSFAVWARRKLISEITYRAGLLGVTENGAAEPLPQSTKDLQFFDVGTKKTAEVQGAEIAQRGALVAAIQSKARDMDYKAAFQSVAEEVAYRDISFGNMFFDPDTGEVLICDNDNVSANGIDNSSVYGTPRFMAPEIVMGRASPSRNTDLYSLAVLLFYMFMMGHPLEGKLEAEIKCMDIHAMNKLYGRNPIFIYDPNDKSNRPVKGYQDNVIIYWELYPQTIRDLFTKSFTVGLTLPNKRVTEKEWLEAFANLLSGIVLCPKCGAEVFFDAQKQDNGVAQACWNCKGTVPMPVTLAAGKSRVLLQKGTKLFAHHIYGNFDMNSGVGSVVQNPKNPNLWGIRNESTENWTYIKPDGTQVPVAIGKSAAIAKDVRIDFGQMTGEFK